MSDKKYWENICNIQEAQTKKGIKKYGTILEDNNKLTFEERINYLEEELIDGLMYCEHLKQFIKDDNKLQNSITANEYQKLALRTANTEVMKDSNEKIINGILGLSGESGEVADHIKKFKYQGHQLDKDYLAKELGDICWYIALLADGIGFDLSTIMQMNIEKLKKRYPEGFDSNRSLYREDEN